MYYKDMPENTVEDFVYIVRTPADGDPTGLGDILEVKRPDGSGGCAISATGSASTILGTHNGMFFYKVGETVYYTNLANVTNGLIKDDGTLDETLKLPEDVASVSGKLDGYLTRNYTSAKYLNPNRKNAEDVYVLGASSSGLFLWSKKTGAERKLYSSEPTIVAVEGNYAYFTAGTDQNGTTVNALMRVDMFVDGAEPEVIMTTESVNSEAPYKYDLLPDFVAYYADIDTDAKAYTFFKRLDTGDEAAFIGYRTPTDTVPEDSYYPVEDEE
jgi:hypothetical protein